MANCIVCGKAAGPFNTLHKTCLSIYRNTETYLQEKFSLGIQEPADLSEAIEAIENCKPSTPFSDSLFKELLIKVWSNHADQCVKSASLNSAAANNLINLAGHFDLHGSDEGKDLLNRLANIETLERLQLNKPIQTNVVSIPEQIVLSDEEKMIWRFEDIARAEQQRYSQEKTWTVLRSVLDNTLLKSRYKQLATKTDEAGELFLTNHALYYLKNNKVLQTKFINIHSVTPIKQGIRIQATTRGATPETYITGDGRFAYAMLQYARGLET